MNPRKPMANWHNSAHGETGVRFAVVCNLPLRDHDQTLTSHKLASTYALDCYPSLPLWPVRSADGPFFFAACCKLAARRVDRSAKIRHQRFFPFSTPANPLRMRPSLHSTRGRLKCSNPLFLLSSCQPPLPLVWPMTPNASLSGLPQVLLPPMSLATTRFWVLVAGRLPGLSSSKRVRASGPIGQGASLTQPTYNRGSKTCINPLSYWHLCQPLCLDALSRTTVNAPLSAVLQVPLVPAPWAMTRSPVQPSASVLAPCAARLASASASNSQPIGCDELRAIRGNPRVALFIARPGRGQTKDLWGDQCSKRS